jgi:hypothetical protein
LALGNKEKILPSFVVCLATVQGRVGSKRFNVWNHITTLELTSAVLLFPFLMMKPGSSIDKIVICLGGKRYRIAGIQESRTLT